MTLGSVGSVATCVQAATRDTTTGGRQRGKLMRYMGFSGLEGLRALSSARPTLLLRTSLKRARHLALLPRRNNPHEGPGGTLHVNPRPQGTLMRRPSAAASGLSGR